MIIEINALIYHIAKIIKVLPWYFNMYPMPAITLMDIINIESSLGEKIFSCYNKACVIARISNTCRVFNKIIREEMTKRQDEYFIVDLPKIIEKSVKKFTYINLGFKSKNNISKVEKEYVGYYINSSNMDKDTFESEYEAEINAFDKKINNSNYYDNILQQMIKQFKHYVVLSNNYMWQGFFGDFYRTIMIYYYVFIKCVLKYKLVKKDFEGEEHHITMLNRIFTIELIE